MDKLIFPELIDVDEILIPETEDEKKKKVLTDDEIVGEAMQLILLHMPRIHKLIELMWGHPKDFDPWISDVCLDDRGGRQGFPPSIMSALTKIHNIHVKKFGAIVRPDNVWYSNQKLY